MELEISEKSLHTQVDLNQLMVTMKLNQIPYPVLEPSLTTPK